MNIDRIKSRLDFRLQAYEKIKAAYLSLLEGNVKSYTIGDRVLTKLDLPVLKSQMQDLENEIDALETALAGGGKRKTMGVVIRDW